MVFRTKAKEVREDPFKGMSPDEAANIQINIISNSCALLHSLGYEIAAIAAKDNEPSHVFGSPKGLEFIQGAKIQNDFRESVFGNIVYVDVKNEKETKQDLSEQVRKIFNSCWASVSSKKQAVPYGSLFKRKEFKMEGLPDGIEFKDPSSYGLASLRLIISHKDAIKFVNVKPASSTSADVSDSPHLLLASNSINAVEEVEGSEGNRILTDSVHLRANTSDPIVDDGTGILADSVHLRANTSDPIVDDGTGILTDLRNVEMEEVEGAPDIPLDVLESLADTMGEFIEEEQSVALPKDEIKMKLESGLYPVARIMGKKRKGRKHLYKIHWEGCKASEATWEPTENIPKPLLKLYNKK
ncbi:general transcription factor II-I-like [Mytilus trossulus]|uniref:general transcription factor II-I-like n=1 Tax=Mytilus trossulus TaxID=6551 RepID=UPI003005D0BD